MRSAMMFKQALTAIHKILHGHADIRVVQDREGRRRQVGLIIRLDDGHTNGRINTCID